MEAIPYLNDILSKNNKGVRAGALKALLRISPPEEDLLYGLRAALHNGLDQFSLQIAIDHLRGPAPRQDLARKLVPELELAARSRGRVVRHRAEELLKLIR